ncbi:MAG: site-specific integrase [Candidatus Aminicenantes bacterium]|nr:site-specific integrase [Candidatus Aminicenantes bacterium]
MGVYKDKKTKKWFISYTLNGQRIRKSIGKNKKQAVEALNKIQYEISNNRFGLAKKERIKFFDFTKKYLKEYSIPTKKSYKNDISRLKNLMPYFGDLYLDEISNYHFEQYRNIRLKEIAAKRKNLVSPTTVNREGALLLGVLNKAVKWGFLGQVPLKIEMRKELRKENILPIEEIKRLIANAEPPLRHIILIAINTGMRKGEILNLEWSQVNFENSFVTLRAQSTKSGELRRIPLNETMKSLFAKLYQGRGDSGYVFTSPKTGKPYIDLKKSWYSLLKRCNIKDFRFHDLRHCFATYTLLKRPDMVSLQEILGHADISTTSRYTKALLEGQQMLVNSFEVSGEPGEIIEFPKKKIVSK